MMTLGNYKIQVRDRILGGWYFWFFAFSGGEFFSLVIAIIVLVKFRDRLNGIIDNLFCGLKSNAGDSLEGASYQVACGVSTSPPDSDWGWVTLALVGCLVAFSAMCVLSSWFRRVILGHIFSPIVLLYALIFLSVAKYPDEHWIHREQVLAGLVSIMCAFYMFFEVVPKSPEIADEILQSRWLAFWRFRLWKYRRDIDEFSVIFKWPVMKLLELWYLDSFGIKCLKCQKAFFLKGWYSFNPSAECCEHCGFDSKAWAQEKLKAVS